MVPKFSITTPCWYDKEHKENIRQPRYEMFLRCANSVFAQTFDDYEWVIADDISNPSVQSVFEDMADWYGDKGLKVKTFLLPEKSGRIVARNKAMENSVGEWITWLDSDDEYASIYLQAINDAIRVYPEYKVFNFNHLIYHHDYNTEVRKFINMDIQKDAPFGSGHVGAGSFVFHRSVFEDIGKIPELGLWDFAAKAFEEFPEIKPFFWNDVQKGYNSIGNPWGEDYYYFYKMTRKYKAKYLNSALYYVHSRFDHRWADDTVGEAEPGKKPEWNPNYR
jgi:glycosyltransferase involved in cell wall biosynthesis